jgi:glucosamine--fructose-6-phosphate aminotransferase (isomerizing)
MVSLTARTSALCGFRQWAIGSTSGQGLEGVNSLAGAGDAMFDEAAEAPAAVARQAAQAGPAIARVAGLLRRLSPRLIVTCARGSSDHAATFAKYLIESRTGLPTASAAPSIASLYGRRPRLEAALFVAISQSGRSPDLVATAEAARAGGAFVLALVNADNSPLGEAANEVIPLCAGPELSVAATKSYVATLAALVSLVGAWTEDEALTAAVAGLPERLERAWAFEGWSLVDLLAEAQSAYVIGRGLGLGVAQEAALKLKETSRLHAEAFSAAELRHGPLSLVGPDFPVVAFRQSDATAAGTDELLTDLGRLGARVLALPLADAHPVVQPILQILSFYRAAHELSIARGLDPDRPVHLAKVTETL